MNSFGSVLRAVRAEFDFIDKYLPCRVLINGFLALFLIFHLFIEIKPQYGPFEKVITATPSHKGHDVSENAILIFKNLN